METTKVQVIGGGPGGLFAARLVKLRHPGWHVEVHERMPAGKTFGFGVGLTGRTLRNLLAADPAVHESLITASHTPRTARLHTLKDSIQWGRRGGGDRAIGRSVLLKVLQTAAVDAGVAVRAGSELMVGQADADLIIAADGAGSATRDRIAGTVGASVRPGRGLYIWCGLDRALDGSLFAPMQTDYGLFVTHAYAYAADRSTVLVETDEQTWHRAGFDRPQRFDSDGESDADSIAFLQRAFAPHLAGGRLLGNRSRWLRFRTVHCDRWHDGRTVLLGDAARTAHYSLGAGTKLALEDATALAGSLTDSTDIPAHLAAYEAARRPGSARTQDLAQRSQTWWDGFPQRADMPAASVAFAYLTRGGAVSLPAVAAREPEMARAAMAEYAGCPVKDVPWGDDRLAAWVLSRSYHSGRDQFASRVYGAPLLSVEPSVRDGDPSRAFASVQVQCEDPLGAAADAVVEQSRDAVSRGAAGVLLGGPDGRGDVLDRLALAERVRRESPAVVAVAGPREHLSDLVDGLVARRTDLVSVYGDGHAT